MDIETESTTTEVFEPNLCDMGLTIPISHLTLEVSPPIGGWTETFDAMGIKVVTDPAGRLAISTIAARRLLSTLRRRDALFVEDAQRRAERLAAKRPVTPGGVPAIEGASALESLAASPGYQLPSDEFQDIRRPPRPRFVEEAVDEGERHLREKQRLIDQAKDKLGGRR